VYLSPSSRRAISFVLTSPMSQELARPPLLPFVMMAAQASMDDASWVARRKRTNSGMPFSSKPLLTAA
jgi:hypothetical protein